MALTYVDAYDDAERAYAASIEAGRRLGLQHIFSNAQVQRADTRYRAGCLRPAIADAESAIETGYEAWNEIPARSTLALCLLDIGDIEGAKRVAHVQEAERWSAATHLALFYETSGQVHLACGRLRDAAAAFRNAGIVASASGAHNPSFCAWRSRGALAEAALGNRDEARRLSAEEVELAKAFGAKRAIGIALRAQGLVEGGPKGLELLREAVDVLADSPARLEHARALTDLGAALRRAGLKSDAQENLRLALDLAASCEADGLARRARDELVAAGGRPRRERLSGIASLTPQEHRIADLVVQGLSNREIAQSLFLTRKTIETHLTSTYAKLGIRSRDDLRAALEPTRSSVAETSGSIIRDAGLQNRDRPVRADR